MKFQLRSDTEREDAEIILQGISVIFRVISSTEVILMDDFEAYVKSIMTKICTVYFFAPIPITGLRTMSHCIEKMRKRGNRGLGQVSEGYELIGVEISEYYSLMMFL